MGGTSQVHGEPNHAPHRFESSENKARAKAFRSTLAVLGETLCRTPEEFKAWSQNLGHEHVATTLTSYGTVPEHRQADILQALSRKPEGDNGAPLTSETIRRVLQHLQQQAA